MLYDDYITLHELIAEALELQKQREKSVLNKWLGKIETFKETIGYSVSMSDKEVIIYTKSPGILIGRAGITVYELKALLSEEFGGEWSVKFVEIRGGFIKKEV